MSILFCQVKCVSSCGVVCLADTVSPIADVLGFAAGEGRFMSG